MFGKILGENPCKLLSQDLRSCGKIRCLLKSGQPKQRESLICSTSRVTERKNIKFGIWLEIVRIKVELWSENEKPIKSIMYKSICGKVSNGARNNLVYIVSTQGLLCMAVCPFYGLHTWWALCRRERVEERREQEKVMSIWA